MMTPEKFKTLNINKSSQFEVMINETILGEIHSTDYYLKIQKQFRIILEEVHTPLGQWKQNPKCNDVMFGVVINNIWHRLNTPETNKSGQFYLFKQVNIFLDSLKKQGINEIKLYGNTIPTEKIFISQDWRNDIRFEEKLRNLLRVIRYKSNEWLVPNNHICDELMRICYECMLIGDTAEFLCEMYLNKLHNDIKSYVFTEGLGDCKDIKQGIDTWVYNSLGVESTYQIKHKYFTLENEFIKTDANFSLKSKCNYFVLVYKNTIVKIKNDNKTNKKNGSTWTFPISNCEIFNTIYMFEELKSLMRITGNNNVQMKLTKEGNDNFIDFIPEEKIVIVNFPNEVDETIKEKIIDMTNELQQRFK
jgi:hypothetical protein